MQVSSNSNDSFNNVNCSSVNERCFFALIASSWWLSVSGAIAFPRGFESGRDGAGPSPRKSGPETPVVCVFVRVCANYNTRHSAGWRSRAGKRQVDRKLSLSILSTETEDEWGSASMEKGSNSV